MTDDAHAQPLLRRLAHDVAGTADVVRGATTELKNLIADEIDAAEPLLGMLARSSARLERLAKKLRLYNDFLVGNLAPSLTLVDLPNAVRRAALEAEAAYARRGVGLLIAAEGPCPGVALDGTLLQEALVEVIANAIAHAKSRVVVTCKHDSGERKLRVVVDDDGPGFPANFTDLRQPPQERANRGLGIGLRAATAVVDSMGAALDIGKSELPGRGGVPGARVTFEFDVRAS